MHEALRVLPSAELQLRWRVLHQNSSSHSAPCMRRIHPRDCRRLAEGLPKRPRGSRLQPHKDGMLGVGKFGFRHIGPWLLQLGVTVFGFGSCFQRTDFGCRPVLGDVATGKQSVPQTWPARSSFAGQQRTGAALWPLGSRFDFSTSHGTPTTEKHSLLTWESLLALGLATPLPPGMSFVARWRA